MPLAIALIGVLLVVASIRGKQWELVSLVKDDLTGPESFIPWVGVLIILYMIGKIGPLEEVTYYFLALVIIVLFLTRGRGFFDQFNRQLKEIRQ